VFISVCFSVYPLYHELSYIPFFNTYAAILPSTSWLIATTTTSKALMCTNTSIVASKSVEKPASGLS
jgi:hypothetical protein